MHSAVFWLSCGVSLCFFPSVTLVHCVETAKLAIKLFHHLLVAHFFYRRPVCEIHCQWSDQSLIADKHDCKQSGVTSASKAEYSFNYYKQLYCNAWYYAVYYNNVQNK